MADDVTLYVWKVIPPNDVGHASLQFGTTYVSYWPSDAAGKKDIKIGQTHDVSFPRGYATDRRIEGRDPERRVLRGLDTQRMKDAWDAFRGDPLKYNMVDHNCSTVIAGLLELGSGIKPSFVPGVAIDDHTDNVALQIFLRIRFLSGTIKMWTPDAVLRYADEIQAARP